MAGFKPDGTMQGSFEEDLPPVPRHEFTEANQLHLFPFDEDMTELSCPDCGAFCVPENLGEAVDWALGHQCAEDEEYE